MLTLGRESRVAFAESCAQTAARGPPRNKRRGVDRNPSLIALCHWISPVVIYVAIEDFNPRSRKWESHRVVVPGCFRKSRKYNYVIPCTLKPPVRGSDGRREMR